MLLMFSLDLTSEDYMKPARAYTGAAEMLDLATVMHRPARARTVTAFTNLDN